MAATSDPGKTTLDTFDGVRNLARESSEKPNALREAVNIDLDKEGKPSTRVGRTLQVACTHGHSLWSHPNLPFALFVDNGTLRALFPDMLAQDVRAGLARALEASYALVNDVVLWSNRQQSGIVTMDLEADAWACPNPAGQPDLSLMADTGDLLTPGTVQVAITYIDARGRESGSTLAVAIDVDGTQAVVLERIPQPADPAAVPWIRVYATSPGGEVLERAAVLPAGTDTYILTRAPSGPTLKTQFLAPMPPGQIVRTFNGRQLVAAGKVLFWSPALRYGLYDTRNAYMRFHADIDMVEPVGEGTTSAGVYVSAGADNKSGRTFFLNGADPAAWRQSIKYPHGAVPMTAAQVPAEHWGVESKAIVPAWLARNGLFCLGLPDGQVVSFKKGDAVAATGEAGASLFREVNGMRQFITALRAPSDSGLKIRDRAIAISYPHEGG